MNPILQARDIADDILFPQALEVDQSGQLPLPQLQHLVEAGLYGLTGPVELGGRGANTETLLAVIEAIAGGCLTTCFVWTQHQGACRAVADSTGPVRDAWAAALSSGQARSGVAFAHLLRPGTPMIGAEPGNDGWRFTGVAPWVTGWGYIDVFHVAARHGDDIVWALVDAKVGPGLEARPLKLAAIDSSATNEIIFDQLLVPAERVTKVQPFAEWRSEYPTGLRVNGSLSLGVAARAATLLGPSPFDAELAEVRAQLDTASVDELPEARGRASALTVRLTASLVASLGGRAIVSTDHGQRLAREALFLLIQGQTPEIRASQLRHL